ncbi:hypothetical protein [Nocardia sp. N2S4-5]|uniref:hypothetical protein n=1 Tax=Nocardia sp. N2S4-5 TaxID=3351565 RepID=UPI0037D8FE74
MQIRIAVSTVAAAAALLAGAGAAAAETEPAPSPVQGQVSVESFLHQFIANAPIGSGSWCSFHDGPCER